MLAHFTQRTTHQSEHLHPLSDTKNKGPCTRPVHTATTVGKPANSGSAMPTFLFDKNHFYIKRIFFCKKSMEINKYTFLA